MLKIIDVLFCSLFCFLLAASCKGQPLQQKKKFTKQDTLRGSITPERGWWDVVCDTVAINTDYNNKGIEGKCDIQFRVLNPGNRMQIDLQQPMIIHRVFNCYHKINFFP